MKPAFENFRLPVGKIFLTAVGLVVLVIVISTVLSFWQRSRSIESPPEVAPNVSARHQVEFESGELSQKLRAQQQKQLQTYSWKDQQMQTAEVPIERAMEALAAEAEK